MRIISVLRSMYRAWVASAKTLVPSTPSRIARPLVSHLHCHAPGLRAPTSAVAFVRLHNQCTMKGSKQASIASFFAVKGGTSGVAAAAGASRPSSTKAGLEDSTNQQPPVSKTDDSKPAAKRKRLTRAVTDSPVKESAAEAALEDEVDVPKAKPASPKRARPSSPRKTTSTTKAPPAAASPVADVTAALPTLAAAAQATEGEATAKATPAAKSPAKVPGTTTGKKVTRKVSKVADEEEDQISFTSSSSDSGSGASEAGGEGGAGGSEATSRVKRLKRSDDTTAPKKSKKSRAASPTKGGKVEGVGSGAKDAARRAVDADIPALCTWQAGEQVPYRFLADTFETIAETSGRLDILYTLTNCFRAILATTPEDLLPTVYMCANCVAPAHFGIELGVGESILMKALSASTGRTEAALKKDLQELGDLGKLAVQSKGTQKMMFTPKPLTIRGVFQTLKDIAETSGSNSQEKKKSLIIKLLSASKGNESGYIMRSLQAKLRIGLAEQSVLVALAHATLLHREGADYGKDVLGLADKMEQAAQAVKAAYSECPSYDVMVPALIEHGLWDLDKYCHFMPSVPVKPMLAKPTTGVSEVIDKFTGRDFTCEYKYDGERAQVHVMDGGKNVMIFSRSAENMTSKYPDITARIPALLGPGVQSAVFDGEAVAWDPVEKKILPFQVLSTRKRKDVALGDITVQVVVFVFDCLYLNGRSLLQEPLVDRRKAMYESIKEKEGELQYAIAKTSGDVEELQLFLNEAVDAATEGLIVKTLNDTYEPSKRSSHWLKLKKDYLAGVGDTFDVVPIGAFYGKGKRTGVYGAYLLAVYDPQSETYQSICKVGTGFSDEQLQELYDGLKQNVIPSARKYYQWGEEPDVWFDTVQVWEVKAADLSISPVHKAAIGLVDPTKGISIRFPRLVRVRDDKKPEDTTSPQQVVEMYNRQAVMKKNAKPADDDN